MTEHKCRKTGKWRPGFAIDCDKCHPPKPASPGYLREGYQNSKRKTIKDSRGSSQTEHWSGRIDAEIKPEPAKLAGRAQKPGR